MTSITIGVERSSGSPTVELVAGSLVLDADGVRLEGAEQSWSWGWADVRVEFEPAPEPGQRGLVASLLGAVGFSNSKNNVPALRVTAPDVEVAFELPNVEGDLAVIATRIAAQFPAAQERITVRDQPAV